MWEGRLNNFIDGVAGLRDQLTWPNFSLTTLRLEGRASLTKREDLRLEFAYDADGVKNIEL